MVQLGQGTGRASSEHRTGRRIEHIKVPVLTVDPSPIDEHLIIVHRTFLSRADEPSRTTADLFSGWIDVVPDALELVASQRHESLGRCLAQSSGEEHTDDQRGGNHRA
ncbi:hypothetical protein D3C81_2039670 [compost metagenome]